MKLKKVKDLTYRDFLAIARDHAARGDHEGVKDFEWVAKLCRELTGDDGSGIMDRKVMDIMDS